MDKKVICNCCGRQIDSEQQDYIYIKKEWGYFSKRDGCIMELCICEDCYDEIEKKMALLPKRTEVTEFL